MTVFSGKEISPSRFIFGLGLSAISGLMLLFSFQPYGKLIALDVDADGSPAVLVENVSLGTGGTPYLFLGDLLRWAALAGHAAFIVFQSMAVK